MEKNNLLVISGSPHIHTRRTTSAAMWHVVAALLPALLAGWFIFGLPAVAVTLVTVAACVVVEFLITRFMLGRRYDWRGGSAVVTGLLLAMSLPSGLPLWVAAIGALAAIGIGKMPFGGLGCNIFNPAMVGRVFLLLSFPAQMTTWPVPGADGATGATALSLMHTEAVATGASAHKVVETVPALTDMLLGQMAGSLGEVSAIALLLGALYLIAVRIISWHIPVAVMATVALFAWATGVDVGEQLLSGGLIIGACFMATDYVTSPMTRRGMLVFGIGIGAITFIIRQWGAYPEGMSFAILIMNGLVPLIDRCFKTRKFGERRLAI